MAPCGEEELEVLSFAPWNVCHRVGFLYVLCCKYRLRCWNALKLVWIECACEGDVWLSQGLRGSGAQDDDTGAL